MYRIKSSIHQTIMDIDDILIEAAESDEELGEVVSLLVQAQEKLEEALDELPKS